MKLIDPNQKAFHKKNMNRGAIYVLTMSVFTEQYSNLTQNSKYVSPILPCTFFRYFYILDLNFIFCYILEVKIRQ